LTRGRDARSPVRDVLRRGRRSRGQSRPRSFPLPPQPGHVSV